MKAVTKFGLVVGSILLGSTAFIYYWRKKSSVNEVLPSLEEQLSEPTRFTGRADHSRTTEVPRDPMRAVCLSDLILKSDRILKYKELNPDEDSDIISESSEDAGIIISRIFQRGGYDYTVRIKIGWLGSKAAQDRSILNDEVIREYMRSHPEVNKPYIQVTSPSGDPIYRDSHTEEQLYNMEFQYFTVQWKSITLEELLDFIELLTMNPDDEIYYGPIMIKD